MVMNMDITDDQHQRALMDTHGFAIVDACQRSTNLHQLWSTMIEIHNEPSIIRDEQWLLSIKDQHKHYYQSSIIN